MAVFPVASLGMITSSVIKEVDTVHVSPLETLA